MPSKVRPHRESFDKSARRANHEHEAAAATGFERARVLAKRLRLEPVHGDKEARLAAIRSRWYGLDKYS